MRVAATWRRFLGDAFAFAALVGGCGGRAASVSGSGGDEGGALLDGSAQAGRLVAIDAESTFDSTAASAAGAAPGDEAGTDAGSANDANADSSANRDSAIATPVTCQCRSCCNALGVCQMPVDPDTQCGASGTLCIDCTLLGGHCVGPNLHCVMADGGTLCVQTCEGCCGPDGTCHAGFADVECGENGGQCQDCTMLNPPSTCDFGSYPQSCASTQTQCPGPYGGCSSAASATPIAPRPVCSAIEIQGAAAACSGGATSLLCTEFMFSEARSNDSCQQCLGVFAFDFAQESAIVACASPYLDAACNERSACLADCVTRSCSNCLQGSGSSDQCAAQVTAGACSTYLQADECLAEALTGVAALCSPDTYQGSFSAWLQAVVTQYCGD